MNTQRRKEENKEKVAWKVEQLIGGFALIIAGFVLLLLYGIKLLPVMTFILGVLLLLYPVIKSLLIAFLMFIKIPAGFKGLKLRSDKKFNRIKPNDNPQEWEMTKWRF